MSQNQQQPKQPKAPKAEKQAPVEVSKCQFESCKSKPQKFGFCMEHYELYMAGVIRGDGKKPVDYEEKLALHERKKQKIQKVA